MPLSLIVAMDDGRLIGRDNTLPWRLPEDLKHFKRLTLGKTVLMGRKTWDSLGRPLPERQNWVLSRDPSFKPAGARVFATLEAALAAHRTESGDAELMVIGGAALFRDCLPLANRIYLTSVHARLAGDVRFPEFDESKFREVAKDARAADERHAHAYTFVTLERI